MEGNRLLSNRAEDYNYNWMHKKKGEGTTGRINKGYYRHSEGKSESRGVALIARPKGGRRSMCMDLEEVKASIDLGFELEMVSHLSISAASIVDTSSVGNSPMPHCHVSSPGNSRDVKARLKRWAQTAALASTSQPTTSGQIVSFAKCSQFHSFSHEEEYFQPSFPSYFSFFNGFQVVYQSVLCI